MTAVAVHEPQALYRFFRVRGKPQLHQVRQAKTQHVGKKCSGVIEIGGRQDDVTETLVPGHEAADAGR